MEQPSGISEDFKTEKPSTILLVRFGENSHLESFRQRGEIFARPVEFFAKLEDGEGPRGDPGEGAERIYQPKDVTKMVIRGVEREFTIDSAQFVGPIRMSLGETPKPYIYCMSAILPPFKQPVLSPRNTEFGDSMVLVTKTQEFLNRVKGAIEGIGGMCSFDLVEYYEGLTYSGKTGVFKKSDTYEYQSEFRFAIYLEEPLDAPLEIGNLEDITTEVFPSSKILTLGFEYYDGE